MRYTDTEVIAGLVLTWLGVFAAAGVIGGLLYVLIVCMMAAIP